MNYAGIGRVLKVIDGDTITILMGTDEIRVRLIGIDAPEKGEWLYSESKAFLEGLMASNPYVEIYFDGSRKDNYNRTQC